MSYLPEEPLFDPDADLDADLDPADSPLAQVLRQLAELEPYEVVQVRLMAEAIVPRLAAHEIDISAETAEQFTNAKMLMAVTVAEKFATPTQKSATLRNVTAALRALTDLQARAYNIDTVKQMEQALLQTLRDHPDAEALVAGWKDRFERLSGRRPEEHA